MFTAPLEVCMVSSAAIKASPWGGGFQVISGSSPLGCCLERHGVFCNKTYFPPLGGTAMPAVVWESP